MQVFRAMAAGSYTVEEVDAITGPAIGRPKSATFRTWTSQGWTCWRTSTRGLARAAGRRRTAGLRRAASRRATWSSAAAPARRAAPASIARTSGEILALDFATLGYRPPARPRFPRRSAEHPEHRRTHPHAVPRQGSRRRVPARDACADVALCRARCSRIAHSAGGRGSRDALGFRLGARAIRDAAGDRRRQRDRRASVRSAGLCRG